MKERILMAERDAQAEEAAQEQARRQYRSAVIQAAMDWYRVVTQGTDAAGERRALTDLYEACDALETQNEEYRLADQVRKAAEKARRMAEHEARCQAEHAAAKARAAQEGRVHYSAGEQKRRKAARAAARQSYVHTRPPVPEEIALAHQGPAPPSRRPETRDERLVAEQLRSFGSVIHVNTGNIEWRLKRPKRGSG